MTKDDFQKSIIAQSGDSDQSGGHGFIVWRVGVVFYLSRYSTDSLDDTLGDLCGLRDWTQFGAEHDYHPGAQWSGTREEIVRMANENRDPAMPERIISEYDHDYCNLTECYQQVLAHFAGEAAAHKS